MSTKPKHKGFKGWVDKYIEHHWVRFGIILTLVVGIAILLSFLHNEHLSAAVNSIDSAIATMHLRDMVSR